jgi:excisionase family DNA binding protein
MTAVEKKLNELLDRMTKVEKCLLAQKEYLSLEEVAFYLNIKIEAVYEQTSAKTWPTFKPGGKITYVKREDVENWIEASRRASGDDIDQRANKFLIRPGKTA